MSNSSRLALFGGTPVRDEAARPWPQWPLFGDEERRELMEVFESGNWWYGPRVAAFEQHYAAFQGAAHCISFNSGTTALEMALQALGLEPGDEVVVPPYTFFATASAVYRMGGIPVFADVDESWCMDPAAVEAAVTPRTRGIVPVHFSGRIADMDRINEIAARRGLFVLEDACHAWGSRWKGKGAGTLGKCGAFSFQHSKNMTAGEGGALVTDDDEFAVVCKSISNCGRDPIKLGYHHYRAGTNVRISELAAAILDGQLTRMEAHTELRQKNAAILDAGVRDIEGLIAQPGDPRITRRSYHLYCLRIDPERFGCSRERFVEAARAEGLPIGPGYAIPLYRQPFFQENDRRDYRNCGCPVAEDLCGTSGMWFRHALLLTGASDMNEIVEILRKVKDNVGTLRA